MDTFKYTWFMNIWNEAVKWLNSISSIQGTWLLKKDKLARNWTVLYFLKLFMNFTLHFVKDAGIEIAFNKIPKA